MAVLGQVRQGGGPGPRGLQAGTRPTAAGLLEPLSVSSIAANTTEMQPVSGSILYLGDTHLESAAAYLAGLMHRWGWTFDYVPSHEPLSPRLLDEPRALFVLSDYPAACLATSLQQRLIAQVVDGAGLVMIGGWESFHGCGGDWDGTSVAEALPVIMERRDDRINCDQPTLLCATGVHPVTQGLPWEAHPPLIGGLNRIQPKPDATTLLEAQRFRVSQQGGRFVFEPMNRYTVLVVGRHGRGRTAALATDVAPHWVGGLVDWGERRIRAQAPSAEAIEVGQWYEAFFHQLLRWVGQLDA